MIPLGEIVIPVTSIAIGAGAVFQAGKLSGRFDAHEIEVKRRLGSLEEDIKKAVSRDEIDHRFEALEHKVDDVLQIVRTLGKQRLRSDNA